MKVGKASATARLIAAATVMCVHDAATSDLVRARGGTVVRGVLVHVEGGSAASGKCPVSGGKGSVEACGACDASRHHPALDDAQKVDRIAGPGCHCGWGGSARCAGGGIRHAGRPAGGGTPWCWLAMKDERFLWSLNPARAVTFAQELGWAVTGHADSVVLSGLAGSAGGDHVIARGEEVIEAITIDACGISGIG